MKILDYIKSFKFGKFFKRDLRDRIRVIRQKLEEVVIPSLEDIIANPDFQSPNTQYAKKFLVDFDKMLPSNLRGGRGNQYKIIRRSLGNAVDLCVMLEDLVAKEMPDTLYIDGITYQKGTILRIIELLDFTADYASRQLCYLVTAEVNKIELPFTKSEASILQERQFSYFKALEMFFAEPKTIINNIGRLPEVLLDTSSDVNAQQLGDPIRLGVIPLITPFFSFVGTRMADWDYERYEKARKERKQVELQLELLRQRNAGEVDARTEAVIKGYERELTILRDKISRMEDKVFRE